MAAAAGAGPPDPEIFTLQQWGAHLNADYRHDKLNPNPPYNIGGATAERHGDEAGFFNWAMQTASSKSATFATRIANKIDFSAGTVTGTFKQQLPPLIQTGNNTLGIITDNGEFITRDYLDAIHVVSFGNALDPAFTPVHPNDKPVYYKPEGNPNIYIDLQQFGFDSSAISGIWIADISNGSEVRSAWVRGKVPAQFFDPMDGSSGRTKGLAIIPLPNSNLPLETPLAPKVMNRVGGCYASVAGANTGGGITKLNKMIGKTLGDTMIVASAMTNFLRYDISGIPTVPNPFNGEGQVAGWKNYDNQTPTGTAGYHYPQLPSVIAVKTGDRLNAVRSILKNVPTIFEQLEAGNQPRHFQFYPGTMTEEQLRARLPALYESIIVSVNKRYNDLIGKFRATIDPSGTPILRRQHSRFHPEDDRPHTFWQREDNDDHMAKRRIAARDIEGIAQKLEVMRGQVVAYFQRLSREALTPDGYNTHIREMIALCPQTDEVVRYEEGANALMRLIIPITRMSVEGVPGPTEIHLYALFKSIDLGDNDNGRSYRAVYNERFGIEPEGAMRGGSLEGGYAGLLQEYITLLTPPAEVGDVPANMVMIREPPDSDDENNPFLLPFDHAPLTCAFVENNAGKSPLESINCLHRLFTHRENPYIMDNSMLMLFEREFEALISDEILVLTAGEVPEPLREDILRFNVFTSDTNHNSAMIDPSGDTIGFDTLKLGFERALNSIDKAAPGPPLGASASAPEYTPGLIVEAARRGEKRRADPSSPARGIAGMLSPAGSIRGTPEEKRPRASSAPPTVRRDEGSSSQSDTQVLFRDVAGDWPGAAAGAPKLAGRRTPRRKNRKSTYRLKKKTTK